MRRRPILVRRRTCRSPLVGTAAADLMITSDRMAPHGDAHRAPRRPRLHRGLRQRRDGPERPGRPRPPSDYGRQGGVNPMLGLASGGAFAAPSCRSTAPPRLSFGFTEQQLDHAREAFPLGRGPRRLSRHRSRSRRRGQPQGHPPGEPQSARSAVPMPGFGSTIRCSASSRTKHRSGPWRGHRYPHPRLHARGAAAASPCRLGHAGRTHSAGEPEQGFSPGRRVLSSSFALSATFARAWPARRRAPPVGRAAVPRRERRARLHARSRCSTATTGELGVADQTFDIGGGRGPSPASCSTRRRSSTMRGEVGLFGRAEFQAEGDQKLTILQSAAGYSPLLSGCPVRAISALRRARGETGKSPA